MSEILVPFTVAFLMAYVGYCIVYSEVKNPDPDTYYLFLVVKPANNAWPVLISIAVIAAGVYKCFG
jgi:hypothetical protein